ncbi:hypothetical protein H8356DRAFT_1630675 [Neocallimastix lanati (nom. inval.)]|nr:hypothetical protein H8356DRAFT_1630675 [Neocallimastix sp. JGI-2020a]
MSIIFKKHRTIRTITLYIYILVKMQLIFALHPENYELNSLKVAYVITRLCNIALNWATTLINSKRSFFFFKKKKKSNHSLFCFST